MRAKKQRHEEHVNHEAWAIPYGDLVTLLLAFFVVMYSISSVNEGKYRVLSQSMIAAFHGSPKSVQPIQVGSNPVSGAQVSVIESVRPAAPSSAIVPKISVPGIPTRASESAGTDTGEAAGRAARELRALATEIERAMAPLIADELIMIRRNEQWLEVEIKADILFPSGIADISPSALPVLDELARIFARFPNPIRIEGHTDDRPINTLVFPSNWELSAARGASVVRRFAEHGVAPERLGIVGWGETRPVADNATAEGRNRNRRVLIVVQSSLNDRPRVIGVAAEHAAAESVDASPPSSAMLPPPATGATEAAPASADNPVETGKEGE